MGLIEKLMGFVFGGCNPLSKCFVKILKNQLSVRMFCNRRH
jgi:hypothetical protein